MTKKIFAPRKVLFNRSVKKNLIILLSILMAILLVAILAFCSYGCAADQTVSGDQEGDTEISSSEEIKSHEHIWDSDYELVHHEAVYEQQWHEPQYKKETTYHTVCNTCQKVIDNHAAEHISETGHAGYTTNVPIENEVVVAEGYYESVLVEEAYDELVELPETCIVCGSEKTQAD